MVNMGIRLQSQLGICVYVPQMTSLKYDLSRDHGVYPTYPIEYHFLCQLDASKKLGQVKLERAREV